MKTNQEDAEDRLRTRLTPEFLATLALAVRTFGWMGDMEETVDLARYCYRLAGLEPPPDLGVAIPDDEDCS